MQGYERLAYIPRKRYVLNSFFDLLRLLLDQWLKLRVRLLWRLEPLGEVVVGFGANVKRIEFLSVDPLRNAPVRSVIVVPEELGGRLEACQDYGVPGCPAPEVIVLGEVS